MEKDFLRLIYQKRFKLMNRWNAAAMSLQPKFGASADPIFRSMIFRAFDELVQQLRRDEKSEGTAGPSLLDQMNFHPLPDLDSYRQAWQIGGEVVEGFCGEDARCVTGFPPPERDAARCRVREAIETILERETKAYKRLQTEAKLDSPHCTACGRPFKQ